MWVSRVECPFGRRGRLTVTLAVGRSATAALIDREGLVFASRYAPSLVRRSDRAFFYLLLRGRLTVQGQRHDAPVALWYRESDAEGRLDWANAGEPLRAVELRFPLRCARTPLGQIWTPTPDVLAKAEAALSDPERVEDLVAALVRAELVRPSTAAAVEARYERFWRAVRPLAARVDLLGSLDQVAELAGRSTRSVARDLAAFTAAHVVPFESWRDGTRQFRLKLAVLGLSAPDVPIAEVARAVGYGSVDAMSRAFRDVGQPQPRQIRQELIKLGADLA
ncbi:MAG: AraC family transcriptional regulator [Polyangiaceae bacterium]